PNHKMAANLSWLKCLQSNGFHHKDCWIHGGSASLDIYIFFSIRNSKTTEMIYTKSQKA
ncbi:hypothetical protein NDU88_002401, partial [Pleurodeles waltl]